MPISSTSQPRILREFIPGAGGLNPQNLINVNGVVYFTVTSNGQSQLGTLDSSGNPIPVTLPLGNVTNLVNVNGTLYFSLSRSPG